MLSTKTLVKATTFERLVGVSSDMGWLGDSMPIRNLPWRFSGILQFNHLLVWTIFGPCCSTSS